MKNDLPILYSITDARKKLGNISRTNFWKIRKENKIKPVMIGSRPYIKHEDLLAIVNK